MSWLRSSPLRQSLTRRSQDISGSNATDQKAVCDSFESHWMQIEEIIKNRSEQREDDGKRMSSNVEIVVKHLDHMVTLLLVELHNCNKITLPGGHQAPAPCLEYMLSKNLLDKLYEWSLQTGRFSNAIRLEQLKLFELLVSHSRHQLLVHEPFLRPLLKLLSSSQDEIFPHEVGKRLVILLNQLCVVLMQNVHLLDLFFCSQYGLQHGNHTNFIIFSLLIPYVHCEGTIGHQARDALLLCMSLSQKNSNIGKYIANHSSMSPVLVTGLCGLYSSLPNSIEVQSIDWFRITADDVNELPELTLFMNSLEFCNAVVQVAHPLIRDQLLDFLYQGFLVPVLGPAILQKFKGSHLQTNCESQISAMVYLDLIMRSVTDPGLQQIMIKFLLDREKFDEKRIVDVLIERINSPDSRLCMVALSLFDSLLSLNNEEILMELILKHVVNAPHVPVAQKHKINRINSYTKTIEFFIDLAPEVMKNSTKIMAEYNSMDHQQPMLVPSSQASVSRTIGANWNHYAMHNGDTLYSNYHAYLYDAHQKIKIIRKACRNWSENYFYKPPIKPRMNQQKTPNEQTIQLIKSFLSEFHVEPLPEENLMLSSKQLDSLQSIGESSGYESIKYRLDEDEESTSEISQQKSYNDSGFSATINNNGNGNVTITKNVEPWRTSRYRQDQTIEMELSEDIFTQGTVSLGPFLTSIWSKLQTFTSNSLYVNVHLTGIISRCATFPLPLVHSILLRPDIPTTSDIPSFYQVLKILKQQIDSELPLTEESLEMIDVGRTFLIDREFKLINARKIALEALKQNASQNSKPNTSQVQNNDPFKRQEAKRKSTGNSLMNIFRRPTTSNNVQGISNNLQTRDEPASLEPNLLHEGSNPNVNERDRDLSIAAVLMDEWLKELSAISQEMSIVLVNENIF